MTPDEAAEKECETACEDRDTRPMEGGPDPPQDPSTGGNAGNRVVRRTPEERRPAEEGWPSEKARVAWRVP